MTRKKDNNENVIQQIIDTPFLPKPKKTLGQKYADIVTRNCGTWRFIISLFVFMGIWMYFNIKAYLGAWDPYPFILLNFVLSCLAAIQAPIILMSQNREAEKEKEKTQRDYKINRASAKEIVTIKKDIKKILKELEKK